VLKLQFDLTLFTCWQQMQRSANCWIYWRLLTVLVEAFSTYTRTQMRGSFMGTWRPQMSCWTANINPRFLISG